MTTSMHRRELRRADTKLSDEATAPQQEAGHA